MADTVETTPPVVKVSQVIDVDDPTGGCRVKVRILPEDKGVDASKIEWSDTLMPKMVHVLPKKDEYVLSIISNPGDANSRRYYIGPVIPQLMDLFNANDFTALALQHGAYTNPRPNPDLDPKTKGAFPEKEDIALLGRKNCDLVIKDDEIRLNAGVKDCTVNSSGNYTIFNDENTHAFVKLAYDQSKGVPQTVEDYKSTATIVADKINLIGNRSQKTNCNFDTQDPDELINSDEMKKIMEKAHCLPYGDILVDVLTQFYKCFANHTHPFPMLPPCADSEMLALGSTISTLEEDMVSKNVRIN